MNALAEWQGFYTLIGSAAGAREGWFGIGAAALLFLFIGIRNAWDNITYHVFVRRPASLERPRDERADIQGKN